MKPINYNLTFEPDLKKFTFRGREILSFKITKPLKRIELDAVELMINKCSLNSLSISSFRVDKKNEKLIILLLKELNPGIYQLAIEFEGILNDKLAGFYRSRFIIDNKEKYLATTQFEAADARRAFPCIDNPSYKATFDVSLIVDNNFSAVSNTLPLDHYKGIKSTLKVEYGLWNRKKKGKKLVKFERTPLMSTYLLYIGIGEFEFIEDKYRDVHLRIVTTPGKSKYGRFALDVTKKFLKYFEEYFNSPYPLKKLDLLAIPDFASGAMENWGAITFRENALLLYPGLSSKATTQRIAEVVAHELVHQWFGNLVTMKWWDDLWLNESFATYMACKAMDHYFPEWMIWDQYITDTVFEAMSLDSLSSSHPIKMIVKKISEIDELFDEIAYEKGGSILRMLNLYVGEQNFRNGLRNYIKKFAFQNAEAKDLWRSLDSVSNKPATALIEKYITQVGFPRIDVSIEQDRLLVSQQRFLYGLKSRGDGRWLVPFFLLNKGKESGTIHLLNKDREEIYLQEKVTGQNINKNYMGFFITYYSDDLQSKIGKNITNLNNIDKLGLIHDFFALVKAGKKNLSEFYQFTDSYFSDERSVIVLHYLIAKLIAIYLLINDEMSQKLAKTFAKRSIDNCVGYRPKENETVLEAYLRVIALSGLALLNDSDVKKFMHDQFLEYLKDENSVHSDLRSVVFNSAVWFDDRNYQVIKKDYERSHIQEEKAKFLSALGFSKSKAQIKKTLQYILSQNVPFAFLPYGVSSIARNPYAREIVLDWLMKNWNGLVKRSGGLANMLLRRILQAIIPVSGIGNEKKVENFLKKNKTKGLERSIDQVIEELRINTRFVRRYKN